MSDAKFTPGPWKLLEGSVPNFDGSNVLTVYGPNAKVGESCEVIAAIVDKNHCNSTDIANSRLISAAPEMYETLEKVIVAPKEAIKIMENNGLAIVDLSDKWQKLAFTFYTMLVNSATIAEIAIDKANGIE